MHVLTIRHSLFSLQRFSFYTLTTLLDNADNAPWQRWQCSLTTLTTRTTLLDNADNAPWQRGQRSLATLTTLLDNVDNIHPISPRQSVNDTTLYCTNISYSSEYEYTSVSGIALFVQRWMCQYRTSRAIIILYTFQLSRLIPLRQQTFV